MHSTIGAARLPSMAAGPAQSSSSSHTMIRPSHRDQQPQHQSQSQSQAYQGTLAPGTRLMIGQIVVTVQKYLSQGGFAHVYLVTTEKPIAMPVSATSAPGSTSSSTRGESLHVLKRMAVPDKEALASVRSEVEVHKSLRLHPNIVHFIEASATALPIGGYEIFILMEYCSGGGIIDLMNSRLRNRLREVEVLKIFGDVAAGLSIMHHMDPPLMHRDLKVENILLAPPPRSNPSAGPTYKLCDFGSTIPILSRRPAKSLEEVKRLEADLNKCTTLQYRAPEMVDVYQRRVIDEKADIWAMGVLLYKLCYYTTPFEENGGGPLAILNAQYRFPPMPAYSQRLKDLIASMLQEQSTARPTIDQVIIGVHRILGTTAPASTKHYADLAASGKQVQSLPSVVSSSKPLSNSSADVAAMAMARQNGGREKGPAAGVDKDLIEMGPSAEEKKRIEDEELKKRSEGITPMRRGRPNRGTPTSNTTNSQAAIHHSPTTIRSPSPLKANNDLLPTKHHFESRQQSGFSDSFSPPTHANAFDHTSRPGSGMAYSPSLPGMIPSNRASPLPPPITSPQNKPPKSQLIDEEATSRFPSVEELDKQYSTSSKSNKMPPLDTPRSRTTSSAALYSSSSSSYVRNEPKTPIIPGLADRSPVSAMAGKFGNNVSPTSSDSTSGARRTTISSSSLLAKRWPHEGSNKTDFKGEASKPFTNEVTSAKELTSPTLPARKPYLHDWIRKDVVGKDQVNSMERVSSQDTIIKSPAPEIEAREKNESSSSDEGEDEAEKPEDVDGSVAAAARKRQSVMPTQRYQDRPEASGRQREEKVEQTQSSPIMTEKKHIKQEEEEEEASTIGSSIKIPQQVPAKVAASQSPPALQSPTSGLAVKAPAWDEDDEEMHFLPQPILNSHHYDQGELNHVSVAIPPRKYADASTSPGRGTPIAMSPVVVSSNRSDSFEPIASTERKAQEIVAPKPIRTQTTKDVGGLVKKYQNLSSTDKPGRKDGSEGAAASAQIATESSKPVMTSLQMRKDSLVNGVGAKTSNGPPPAITAPKPISGRLRQDSNHLEGASRPVASKVNLKPWEREELEKEQVHRYGSLRSVSPDKGTPEGKGQAIGSATIPDAQERFSGVSSLINQWQTNSKKGAPGWGTVGRDTTSASSTQSPTLGRQKSKEDVDLLGRGAKVHSLSNGRPLHGRIPSRDI